MSGHETCNVRLHTHYGPLRTNITFDCQIIRLVSITIRSYHFSGLTGVEILPKNTYSGRSLINHSRASTMFCLINKAFALFVGFIVPFRLHVHTDHLLFLVQKMLADLSSSFSIEHCFN